MKLSTALGMLGVMSLPAIASSIASAQDSGWYVGGNAGQSRAKIDNTRIAGDLTGEGIATTTIRDDERHFAYKLFGGYDFNKYFALEAGYFDFGIFGFTANTVPAAGLTGKTKLNGANFDVVGTLPLADKLLRLCASRLYLFLCQG